MLRYDTMTSYLLLFIVYGSFLLCYFQHVIDFVPACHPCLLTEKPHYGVETFCVCDCCLFFPLSYVLRFLSAFLLFGVKTFPVVLVRMVCIRLYSFVCIYVCISCHIQTAIVKTSSSSSSFIYIYISLNTTTITSIYRHFLWTIAEPFSSYSSFVIHIC